MKQLATLFMVGVLAACSPKSAPENTQNNVDAPQDSTQAYSGATQTMITDGATTDSALRADAVSGATAVSNSAMFNGTIVVTPQNHASVTLSMDGTIKSTSILSGMYVKAGQTIATVENPEFIMLQQNYLDAHAQYEYLQKEYMRQQSLSQQEAASQKRFQQSKADYLSMKSRMDAAAAQLSLLGVRPQQLINDGIVPYVSVKAPISGYVTDMQMNIGKHFAAGEPLCQIVDKSRPMLRLTAYEKDLWHVSVGESVSFRVNGLGDKTFSATIVSVGQQVDDANRSIDVYAKITTANDRFRPGMYVSAKIDSASWKRDKK